MSGLASELQPVYGTVEPNEDIRLSSERAILLIDEGRVKLRAKTTLKFLPTPRLIISADLPAKHPIPIVTGPRKLIFPARNLLIELLVSKIYSFLPTSRTGLSVTMTPRIEPFTALGSGTNRLKKIVFHLLNFRDFYGEAVEVVGPKPSHSMLLNQIVLNAEGWKIRLVSMRTTKDKIKVLQATGGYAITHVGQIEREDGGVFTEQEAKDLIESLYYFFSFARGFWVAPILSVGFTHSNERVWEEWGARRVDQWEVVYSWFDGIIGNLLGQVFPGFCKKWQNEKWQMPLKDAIYWYLGSNISRRGVDTGIILTQAALELLAWNYTVKDKQLISEDGFNRLWASDQFRLLLSSLDIPLEVPRHLRQLNEIAQKYSWLDAPQALTEIRNNVVHPKKKVRFESSQVVWEAWNLGLWYIELILLRLFGHSEQYGNRLAQEWRGQTEMVPWVSSDG